MNQNHFPQHFLTLGDFLPEQIIDWISLACFFKEQKVKDFQCGHLSFLQNYLKKERERQQKDSFRSEESLKDHFITMIFTKASTRTRLAFERAVVSLGGHCLFLGSTDSQLSRGENLEDTLKVVERSSDFVVVRNHDHRTLEEVSQWIKVPLINALSDLYHPTEALADVMTMVECLGVDEKMEECKAVFLGDANNVSRSFAVICHLLQIPCHIATPMGKDFPHLPAFLRDSAYVVFSDNPQQAVSGAKFIYTDTWVSMADSARYSEERFLPFQVNETLLKSARNDYIFLHCLPAYRGKEVTADIIDGPHSRVFTQAENRVYTIKALLFRIAANANKENH